MEMPLWIRELWVMGQIVPASTHRCLAQDCADCCLIQQFMADPELSPRSLAQNVRLSTVSDGNPHASLANARCRAAGCRGRQPTGACDGGCRRHQMHDQ